MIGRVGGPGGYPLGRLPMLLTRIKSRRRATTPNRVALEEYAIFEIDTQTSRITAEHCVHRASGFFECCYPRILSQGRRSYICVYVQTEACVP